MTIKGCVLDLRLDDEQGTSAHDYSRYSNDGALTGCKWIEHGLEFNGTSDNVRIPDSESLSPTSAMSGFAWVKGAVQGTACFLGPWDTTLSQRGIVFRTANDKLEVLLSDDGSFDSGHKKYYRSSIVTFDNTWYLVGATFDAGTFKLFVDGVEDTNPTKTYDDPITTIHNSTADFMVGCCLSADAPTLPFNGSIDQVRIYNRALSAAEIYDEYEATKHRYK